MIGNKLGSYEIIEEIGRGGMATVYRAFQPAVDRYVAVKVIKNSILEEPTTRERFQREARLVARLEHPHLLPIYDFDGEHDPPYLVMRFLEGGTLKEVLAQKQLPFEEIAYLFRQIASALDYAHRQGVVHRDIKPSNIMIDREGNAFVTDFGIARAGGEGITGTGAIIGTPDYMPPEQGSGALEVDTRADVYSLGVMFFQMLTGQLPYVAANPMGVIVRHINDPVPSALKINAELPKDVDSVITRAMAKQPDERYPTVNEFAVAVVQVLGGAVASSPITLQIGAQESIEVKAARRAEHLDEINATMARFAAERGASYTPEQSTPTEQQRQMTALLVDVTELGEQHYAQLDEESARSAMDDLWARFGAIGEAHGGTLHSRTGETAMILWGLSQTREDAPEQAIRAGLEMKAAAAEVVAARWGEVEELPFKAGIITGPVLVARDTQSGATSASGATITLASKIKDAAPPGAVLVAYDTFTLVRGVFDFQPEQPVRIKGREPIDVFVAVRARPRAFRLHQRGIEGVETAMIGREPQMKILTDAVNLMVEDNETQIVTVVGDAGVGKSRLLTEFSNYIDLLEQRFWFFQARATQQSMMVPYSLTRDMFSFRFEILDSDSPAVVREKFETGVRGFMSEGTDEKAHYIGQLVGFDFSDIPAIKAAIQSPEQFHDQALRYLGEFFIEATKVNPVLIQIEDIHWADDRSLDLINNLVERNTRLPLFIICMARPVFYERRPSWGEGQLFHARIGLEPLSRLDARRLIREILKKIKEVPTELRDLIADRAEGNPFYIEELIKTLIEDRVILKGSDEWTVDVSRLATVRVPPTLTGVIQARLDSLPPAERALLQRVAVMGRVFWDTAAEYLSLSEGVSSGAVQGALKDLHKRELIFLREETTFEKANEYVFRHAILRDVTYESIAPKQRRAYHALVAEWLTQASGERAGEYAVLIADHLEKAGEPGKAAGHLRQAGEQIMRTGGVRESLALFERALALPAEDSDKAEQARLHILTGQAYFFLSDLPIAEGHLQQGLAQAREASDAAREAQALTGIADVQYARGDLAGADSALGDALEIARRSGDNGSMLRVLSRYGVFKSFNGDPEGAIALHQEQLVLAEQTNDSFNMADALGRIGMAYHFLHDPGQAESYTKQAIDLARRTGARVQLNVALVNLGESYRLQGKLDEARAAYLEARGMAQEAGVSYGVAVANGNLGQVALAAGQMEEAVRALREALSVFYAGGNIVFALNSLGILGVARAKAGDPETGLAWLGLAWHHPACDDNQRNDFRFWLPGLEEQFGVEAVEAGMERGKTLDFNATVENLLKEH